MQLVVDSDDVRVIDRQIRVIGVESARSSEGDVEERSSRPASLRETTVLVDAVNRRMEHGGGRRRPRDDRAVVVELRVETCARDLLRRESGDRRVRDVQGRAGRVEPSGELQLRSVHQDELAARARHRQGELEVRVDRRRLRRDDGVVENRCAAGVHVERIAGMGGILREGQAAVHEPWASAGVDVDRSVNGECDPGADLGRGDRPVSGDHTDLVAWTGPHGRAECHDRREDPAQGDGPNDHEAEGLRIPSGSVRRPMTSPGRAIENLGKTATGGHVARPMPARLLNRLPSDYLSRYGLVLARENEAFAWRNYYYL